MQKRNQSQNLLEKKESSSQRYVENRNLIEKNSQLAKKILMNQNKRVFGIDIKNQQQQMGPPNYLQMIQKQTQNNAYKKPIFNLTNQLNYQTMNVQQQPGQQPNLPPRQKDSFFFRNSSQILNNTNNVQQLEQNRSRVRNNSMNGMSSKNSNGSGIMNKQQNQQQQGVHVRCNSYNPDEKEDSRIYANSNSNRKQKTSDPQLVEEYYPQIVSHLLKQENNYRPDMEFFQNQSQVNLKMRSILIDWLSDVHISFKLLPQTLFLTIQLVDRYLCAKVVEKSQLQLVGITALFIISKYEEIYPPDFDKFVEVTDNTYTRNQLLRMEHSIIETMKFRMAGPTVLEFYEAFALKAGLGQLNEKKTSSNNISSLFENDKTKRNVLCLGRYLIELCQLEFSFNKYKPSIIAAASIFMSQKLFKYQPYWNSEMQSLTKYTEQQLRVVTSDLCILLENVSKLGVQSCIRKFYDKRYEGISKVKISKSK